MKGLTTRKELGENSLANSLNFPCSVPFLVDQPIDSIQAVFPSGEGILYTGLFGESEEAAEFLLMLNHLSRVLGEPTFQGLSEVLGSR